MTAPHSGFLEGQPRLHYLEWNPGGRIGVVLLHGNSANAWWWQPLACVAPSDVRLLALDLRGHGDSEWVRPPAYSAADYAEDVARLIQAADCVRPVAVVGHSMGAVVALAAALRYPALFRAAAAIDVSIGSNPRRERYLARLRSLPMVTYPDLPTVRSRFRLMPQEDGIADELLAEIAEHSVRRSARGYTMKFDRNSYRSGEGLDIAAAIREFHLPLLLVRGEQSRILSAASAAAAASSNPLVQVKTVPGVHHLPLRSPVPLARALEQFVRACS